MRDCVGSALVLPARTLCSQTASCTVQPTAKAKQAELGIVLGNHVGDKQVWAIW